MKVVRVSFEFIEKLCTKGTKQVRQAEIVEGLPPHYKLYGGVADLERNVFEFIFRSKLEPFSPEITEQKVIIQETEFVMSGDSTYELK